MWKWMKQAHRPHPEKKSEKAPQKQATYLGKNFKFFYGVIYKILTQD